MSRRCPNPRCRGFSLVEVLLSLALLVMLMVSLNQFILSMTELWGGNREQRLFDQHARAVARHVEELLQRGVLVPEARRRLRVEEPAGFGTGRGPLLTFDLPAGDRMLPWPDRPLPDVQCAIDLVPGRGLVLHWQSRWELGFGRETPRMMVISPLVSGLEYDYYREETRTWSTQPLRAAAEGEAASLPARCRIHFQHERYSADQVVRIPPVAQGLPAF